MTDALADYLALTPPHIVGWDLIVPGQGKVLSFDTIRQAIDCALDILSDSTYIAIQSLAIEPIWRYP